MKKILVTGSNGQLGNEIKLISKNYKEFEFIFKDLDLDITNKPKLDEYFKSENIDFVINGAAYTAVDKAEDEPEAAKLLNATAVGYLAELSKIYNYRLIHISTDFVLDGKKSSPYVETDTAEAISMYGKTKLEGEKEAFEKCDNAVVIRTSWLYSQFGGNFVKTMIKLTGDRDTLSVVADQIGTPTNAADLAFVCLKLVEKLVETDDNNKMLFHFSNEGVASWYDFAVAVARIYGNKCNILPISKVDYKRKANIPDYSVMWKEKIKKYLDIEIPHWEKSLEICINRIKENE